MSQNFVTDQGTLIVPNAYASFQVQAQNAGLSTTGVLMLIGEAEAGPDFTLEADLELNSFGPDAAGSVLSKYRSGPLVDAFRAAVAPANDPNLPGAPSRIVLVKTNPSAKARALITKWDGTSYAQIGDKSFGKLGNLISASVTSKQSEILPTTGSFTFIPPVGTVSYEFRVNGGAAVGNQATAAMTPLAFKNQVDALVGVLATGGADRGAPPASGNISTAAPGGNAIVVTTVNALLTIPSVGDTLVIPAGSVIAGAGSANVGAYVVTAASANTISATKLSDAAKPGAVIGTITGPVIVAATPLSGTPANDIKAFAPIAITLEAGNPIDGVGKTLEIVELTAGTDLLSRTAFALSTVPVPWVSNAATPQLLQSGAEYIATLNVARSFDGISQSLSAGGEVALNIGYKGTSAALVVTDTALTVTVVGGAGVSVTANLVDLKTIQGVVDFLNSKAGYSASVGSATLGQLPATALDNVTTTCASSMGVKTGRVKIDGYRFFNKVSNEASLVELENILGTTVVQADAGLPQPQALQFLSGGAKGGTTAAIVQAAIDALEKVRGNFVVPLFSRDATADITDGLTDASSSYLIDSINAAVSSHVSAMSVLKKRRNRQGFISKRGTFTVVRAAASNIANARCSMTFEDFKTLSSDGTIKQQQPWMGAVLAAAMQAAGGYRSILAKGINCSGVLQAAADFDDRLDSNLEDALTSGLLPARRGDTGGFVWVSDQTTYTADSNFVFNSIQAMYAADTIAMTLAQRFQKAFLGQSVADISAALALSFLQATMTDFMRLKLIAASDDAPKGFKNAKIQISGNAMIVTLEVKLAGAISYIPITFLASPVQQSAS